MKISVIIPSYYKNSYEDTLKSVLLQNYKEFEVIVVRNGGSTENYYCKDNLKIYEIQKSGVDNARNFGIKASQGEVIAFIDDDAVATKNWLSAIETSHTKLQAPVIGGKVLPKWPKNKKLKWIKGIFLDYLSILKAHSKIAAPLQRYEWLVGANISFKKYIFSKVGYFDEELDRKGESLLSAGEVDMCYRVRKQGYEIMFDPSIAVKHIIKASRLVPQWFIDRAYWQGVSDFLMDQKYQESKYLLQMFQEKNLDIQYKKLSPERLFDSVNELCKYSRSIGYLQSYIKNFSSNLPD